MEQSRPWWDFCLRRILRATGREKRAAERNSCAPTSASCRLSLCRKDWPQPLLATGGEESALERKWDELRRLPEVQPGPEKQQSALPSKVWTPTLSRPAQARTGGSAFPLGDPTGSALRGQGAMPRVGGGPRPTLPPPTGPRSRARAAAPAGGRRRSAAAGPGPAAAALPPWRARSAEGGAGSRLSGTGTGTGWSPRGAGGGAWGGTLCRWLNGGFSMEGAAYKLWNRIKQSISTALLTDALIASRKRALVSYNDEKSKISSGGEVLHACNKSSMLYSLCMEKNIWILFVISFIHYLFLFQVAEIRRWSISLQ